MYWLEVPGIGWSSAAAWAPKGKVSRGGETAGMMTGELEGEGEGGKTLVGVEGVGEGEAEEEEGNLGGDGIR